MRGRSVRPYSTCVSRMSRMNSLTNCARVALLRPAVADGPVVALGHGGLDDDPQLARVVLGEPLAGDRARVARSRAPPSSARRRRAAATAAAPRRRRPPATASRGARARTASSAADERVAREQREHRVDRQQPAAEEARLHAQVQEQRDREDQQQRQPDAVAPREQHRAGERACRRDVAQAPEAGCRGSRAGRCRAPGRTCPGCPRARPGRAAGARRCRGRGRRTGW